MIDLMTALDNATAEHSNERDLQAAREQMNASHRARIGLVN